MTKISQYPEISAPDVDDLLVGTDVENNNATKNFTVQSIVDLVQAGIIPSLQQVANVGNNIVVGTTTAKGINVTLSNNSTLYQNGIVVTVPQQTGVFPTYNPAPDAFVAILSGQNPGTLTGSPVGFLADMTGADNYGFIADLKTGSSTSVGFDSRSFDSHTGNLYVGAKYVSNVRTDVFKVDNDGDTTAKSFIKIGGTNTQYLMADGSVSTATQNYKSYLAYLSYGFQTGFVILVTEVYNDLGVTPTWAIQGSDPIFRATATGKFTLNKTVMFTDTQVKDQGSFVVAQKNNTTNSIDFQLTNTSGNLSFAPFNDLLVEIRVYE